TSGRPSTSWPSPASPAPSSATADSPIEMISKSAHDQWLRQVRRDAYAAFLARADDLVRPMSFWVSGTQEENERHARTVEASSAELHRAVQALSLEAPQEISEQATQVADQARYFAFSHIRLLRGVRQRFDSAVMKIARTCTQSI
ncbi:hypothetical protein ACFWN5_03560, partial [Streptomyces sp. NPDC058430]|uniref:hypothetical protein n=1 Tax=Streptomyces sp. NPDC058430 TaxID=3346495 RepID=UPI00365E3C33